jgi:hypothetical protein
MIQSLRNIIYTVLIALKLTRSHIVTTILTERKEPTNVTEPCNKDANQSTASIRYINAFYPDRLG